MTKSEIGGTNYYIIRLECANLKKENVNKKYYFGIWLLFNCENGGQVLEKDIYGKRHGVLLLHHQSFYY